MASMWFSDGGRPVWAGVAMRWPDGRIVAIEIVFPEGELTLDREFYEFVHLGQPHLIPSGVTRVVVELKGLVSRGWRQGEQYAREQPVAAIAEATRAIEGGAAS